MIWEEQRRSKQKAGKTLLQTVKKVCASRGNSFPYTRKWLAEQAQLKDESPRQHAQKGSQLEHLVIRAFSEGMIPACRALELLDSSPERAAALLCLPEGLSRNISS